MDVNSILENETVKGLLKKVGVSDVQAKSVANQAIAAIQGKYKSNPKQMSSLLSDDPNTPEDESLKSEVENDFVSNLTKKVGLSPDIADKVKSALPDIMNQFSSKLSASGSNNEKGVAGMFDSIKDLFDGDMDNDGKKDEGGMIENLKKKFFG